MKKYILLAILTACVLAISACAYDGRTTEPEPALTAGDDAIYFYGVYKTQEPVHLNIWLDNEEWAHALILAFIEEHPNVRISFEQMGNVDSRGHMLLDGPAGIGADVFAFPHDHVAFAIMDGLIEPIPPALQAKWERELSESAVETITYNGRMHGVPFVVENIALFYNHDLWGTTPPQTWEEVLEFAATYNNPVTHDWAMAWEADNAYFNYIWLTAAGFELFGPNMNDYRQPNFDSPEVAAGLEIFLQMRALMGLHIEEVNRISTEERFRLGEIPLTLTGPWAIPETLENGVNFGVARIPTIGGVQPIAFSGNLLAGVSSFSTPTNRAWAYAFLDFMVSERGAAIQYEYMRNMTSRRDISGIPGLSDDPFLRGIAEQTPYTVPMPTIPQVSQMWTPMAELFQFTWSDELTIPQAQERAMETYRTLLGIAGHSTDF